MSDVIFDLDGTLIDSLPGIEKSARVAIAKVLPGVPMPELRHVIGPPVAQMFAKLWPGLPAESLAQLLAAFRKHYDQEGCLLSEPYPQVPEVLARLHLAGRRLFVLTNKPVTPAKKILAHLGLAKLFTEIMGPDSVSPPFARKPDGARRLAQTFQLVPAATTLVGDGVDDAESAAAGGFRFIAVGYGYGAVADDRRFTPAACLKNICELEPILL